MNARSSSLRAAARDHADGSACRRARNASEAGWLPSASAIAASSSAAVASVACCAARPGERHLERDAGLDELEERDVVGLEHDGDRLADVAPHALALACSSTKMPPPGPCEARIRCELASRRSPSRSVGRLTPNSAASSCSVPRRSPGRRSRSLGSGGSRRRPARWRPAGRSADAPRRVVMARTSRSGDDGDLEQQRGAAVAEARQHLVEDLQELVVLVQRCAPGSRARARGRRRRPRSPATAAMPPLCSASRSMIA